MVLVRGLIHVFYDMIMYMKRRRKKMKNKDFDSFNNDRIAAARKRINDLLLLIRNWEKQNNEQSNSL